MSSSAFRDNTFSFAPFVLDVGAGCAVTGFGFGVIFGFPFPLLFVWAFFGVMFGFLPGLLLFAPTVAASIFLLNRFHLRSKVAAAALGALGGALTYFGILGMGALQYAPDTYWSLAALLTMSGAVGGLVYFWGERVDVPRTAHATDAREPSK